MFSCGAGRRCGYLDREDVRVRCRRGASGFSVTDLVNNGQKSPKWSPVKLLSDRFGDSARALVKSRKKRRF